MHAHDILAGYAQCILATEVLNDVSVTCAPLGYAFIIQFHFKQNCILNKQIVEMMFQMTEI